jgi:hypothetical protein
MIRSLPRAHNHRRETLLPAGYKRSLVSRLFLLFFFLLHCILHFDRARTLDFIRHPQFTINFQFAILFNTQKHASRVSSPSTSIFHITDIHHSRNTAEMSRGTSGRSGAKVKKAFKAAGHGFCTTCRKAGFWSYWALSCLDPQMLEFHR